MLVKGPIYATPATNVRITIFTVLQLQTSTIEANWRMYASVV